MNSTNALSFIELLYGWLIKVGGWLQPVVLLILRLYWGWSFFISGKGKLLNLSKITEFFSSLGIPFAGVNALLAGCTECFGGLLLLVGLASRLVSIPLAFTMLIAYLTADREALLGIFSNTDKFLAADPFLFLLTSVIVLAFGPGIFSVDGLIQRRFKGNATAP